MPTTKLTPGYVNTGPMPTNVYTFNPDADGVFMTRAILREAFKGFVGMQTFCPSGPILDCARAVGIDVFNADDSIVFTCIFDGGAWDKFARADLAKLATAHPDYRIEVTDGRTLYGGR